MNLHEFRARRWLPRPLALLIAVVAVTSIASAQWNEKVLYSFQGIPDGAVPAGGVVFDKAGNLYGATLDGGASTCDGPGQCGTVFQLKPPAQKGGAWTETVLYTFKGHAHNDGATPESGVVIDQAGNLYGVTGYGGSGPCTLLGGAVGCGTAYELSPPARQGDPWKEKVLYSFQGGKDGYVASGDLVFDKAGNLYGATLFGGGKGTTCDSLYGGQCGTVFKLSPPKTKGGKWKEKVLHSFAGGTDGANPNGGLVLDNKGAVYGTSQIGGDQEGECRPNGCGTVFALQPPANSGGKWTGKTLLRFNGQDGENPAAGVAVGVNGDLYGTTLRGGPSGGPGGGTVFRVTPPTEKSGLWKEIILYGFTGDEHGTNPMASLVFDSAGSLYSTTNGGTPQCHYGNVFRMRANGDGPKWSLSVLYGFTGSPSGAYPAARLAFDKAGSLYSTTPLGGTAQSCQGGCGTVFKVSP